MLVGDSKTHYHLKKLKRAYGYVSLFLSLRTSNWDLRLYGLKSMEIALKISKMYCRSLFREITVFSKVNVIISSRQKKCIKTIRAELSTANIEVYTKH